MKKLYFSLLLICCIVFNTCKAQYVTIPDTVFATWLQNNGFAGCMIGNQLDTTCSAILDSTTLNCFAVPIHNLTGVQYFKNLTYLDCSNDSLYFIPYLPATLTSLKCQFNNLDSLSASQPLLKYLNCGFNHISALPTLPQGLERLICSANHLSSLPSLPSGLQELICDSNSIVSLPLLPSTLTDIDLSRNHVSNLPALPMSLHGLVCGDNNLDSLPALPYSLDFLLCENNHITTLPVLPAALITLDCSDNQLNSLPPLPPNLQVLACNYNQITALPALPATLQTISCYYNLLTSLPTLPNVNGMILWCDYNNLTSLPSLPDSMASLSCSHNLNLTCLPELKQITDLNFDSTAISCLPYYGNVTSSFPDFSLLPLCGIFNPTGCQIFGKINGRCYYDQNNNCSFDSIDVVTNYVKTQLYSGGTLQQQIFTGGEGFYSFDGLDYGNYAIQVDTTDLPFILSCPNSGYIPVTISANDSFSYNNDFAFKCRTEGFDIGVQSILNNGAIPRPAAMINLFTIAGDMSELYGAHCASGVGGQVQIIYTGQVAYIGATTGALTPDNISGDTITWNIADFGTVNDFTAFNSMFRIDSNATPGTQACFTVNVTPTAGDYNLSNNTASYCFTIVNALDPNEKEVYPSGNTDTANHWLTYTIHFQNTGNAPAINIRVTDTLDSNLDASTFQLLAYSAKNITQIFGNDVVFNFPNINLPDSATSDSASRGYMQYKIKLKDNLPIGTQIHNTANIYFDLNPAIVTNTTVNTISVTTGIPKVSDELTFQIYPNPAKDYVIIETDAKDIGSAIHITDITGRIVKMLWITGSKLQVNTNGLAGGVYFVSLIDNTRRTATRKLVVQ